MTDPEEVEPNQEFNQKVRSAFQIQDPDQLFIDRLQKELADRYKAVEPSTESVDTHSGRSPWTDKFKRTLSPVAWGAIAVILILSLVWGIKTLIPRVEVGGSIPTPMSPIVSPSPALISTQAEGAEGVTNLPVPAGMPVPWPEEAITSGNADRISLLARWGKGVISAASWAPAGKSFAVATPTGVFIYDANTFEVLNQISAISNSIAYSPDGAKIATGNSDYSITLWDVASGSELRTLPSLGGYIIRLAYSPDGKILAAASPEQPVKLWDAASGQELRTLSGANAVNFVFSPDGSMLATTGGGDWIVRLWDVSSGQELRNMSGHTDWVNGLAFSPDGRMLASTSSDTTIKLWEVNSGNELQTISGQENISEVAFLPDGKTLSVSYWDKPIKLLDIPSGEVLRIFSDTTQGSNMILSPDGSMLLSHGSTGIVLMDVASGEEIRRSASESYEVTSLAVSPDGSMVAAGLQTGSIEMINAANGQELRTMITSSEEYGIISLAFSPDGAMLASGGHATTRVWDVATGEELIKIEGVSEAGWGAGGVPSVDFSPDGKLVAFAGPKGKVRLWDVFNQVELQPLGDPAHAPSVGDVAGVAFSPDGKILASGYAGQFGAYPAHVITLWDLASGQQLRILDQFNSNISSLEFSPDGKVLAAGYWEAKITLWDVTSGSELYTVSFPWQDENSSLVFSPGGDVLAIGCGLGAITLWDVANGKELVTLPSGDIGGAYTLALSPDGKVLISSAYDGTIRLWGIAPQNAVSLEAASSPAGVGVVSISTPVPQVTPIELGIEKIQLPVLLTGGNIQPVSFSPDESYFLYTQQGPMGEPGENLANITLSFLDSHTGENCQGIQETVAFTQTEWGAYPLGVELYERIAWIDDQRMLYISPSGELGAITRCDDAIESLGDGISDKLQSFLGSSSVGEWQIVIRGEQGFWLFTPAIDQAVKLDVPVPPEGQYTPIRWSPWDEQLITSWVDRRPDGLWIILERIDTVTGSTSLLYEVEAAEQLYNTQPVMAGFSWVRKDLILLDSFGWMGLVDLSSQPPRITDMLTDVFGMDELAGYDLSGWGTIPHTVVQENIHVMAETGLASDGQFYLYHPESGLVDQYPLNPPLLIVYPGGEGGIAKPYGESVPANDIYRVVFVDRDIEPYDLQVKGHLPRSGLFSITANVLPGAEKVLFSSLHGISLVDLKTGETTKFWSYENQDQLMVFQTWISRDGKTVLAFAGPEEAGAAAGTKTMYWLRLEP